MAKVSLQNVSRTFAAQGGAPGKTAIADISLEIGNREFVVVTGKLGSGKSTLLRLIAGLESPSRGNILIGDGNAGDRRPNEREVTMVFGEPALYPAMSIRQNISLGLKLRKFSEAEITRRIEDASAALGITDLLEKHASELSTSQRLRASIARASARLPQVLLFDEPLSQMDPQIRAEMRGEIRKLHDRLQTTVLYATADPYEAMVMGERMIVLNEGRVEQDDAPQTVYDKPANLHVAGLLGAPSMNFIRGTLKAEKEHLRFSEDGEGTVDVRIPASEQPALTDFVGKSVVLGIRPEDVEIIRTPKGEERAAAGFPALVDSVEVAGGGAIFQLQTGAHTIMSRTGKDSSATQPAGRRVRFQFDSRRLHFFDASSGGRISP